jgi:L-ribulokinase
MPGHFTIGLDFGTNSVRALVVDVRDGREIGEAVSNYRTGEAGIVLDPDQPDLARQHPRDYLDGMTDAVAVALKRAADAGGFEAGQVIGIGVDTTGSTPIPCDRDGQALAMSAGFERDPNAMAWLWKDHTSHAEAAQITSAAAKQRPHFLAKCGGRYSSEWYWAKLLHCARVAPKAFDAAYTWVEFADWIPAVLTGTTAPSKLKRGICAAGHKAMFNPSWNGYPDAEFLGSLHPGLARVRGTLPDRCYNVADAAGTLTDEWAKKLGLPAGIPVAVGAFDAHLGAVGSGIDAGTLVKIMGTSTCDIMVSPMTQGIADVPGLCGIVPESVLPGHFGLEAGQSAVGDIFNWWVGRIAPGGSEAGSHAALTAAAEKLRPGESGLLSLDWHNGNRTVLVDQRLSGLIVGLSLHSSPAEIYRALIEATAFGSRVIMERFEEYGVKVRRVVNCGGIAARNPMVMQIYADVMNRPIMIARSTQTCALGSAIAAAVVAGSSAGGYDRFDDAVKRMTAVQERVFTPQPASVVVYEKLYRLYRQLHDAFGVTGHRAELSGVMKELLNLRDTVRGG